MNIKIKFELEETELNGEIENLIPSSSGGSLPSGGTTGQVLTKNSDADGDAGWKEPYTYVLPAATAQTLGGVKIGNGINIAEDGTISAAGGATESDWKVLIDHTVTEEEAASNIQWWSTDGTDVNGNNVNAKELLVQLKTFTTGSGRIIFQAYKYNQQNINYLHSSSPSTIANNSTYAILCRMYDTTNVSGERNIEWAFYKNTNQTYSGIVAQGLKSSASIINGINMRIYVDETGLQAGSTIKAYWR